MEDQHREDDEHQFIEAAKRMKPAELRRRIDNIDFLLQGQEIWIRNYEELLQDPSLIEYRLKEWKARTRQLEKRLNILSLLLLSQTSE